MKQILVLAVLVFSNLATQQLMAKPLQVKSEMFNCQWEPLPRTTSGNGMLKGAESAIDCFSQVRLIFIQSDYNPTLPMHLKKIYHSEVTEVTYLDDQQRKIVCRIRPLKKSYDFISEQMVETDRDRNDGDLSQEMQMLIENNIELECPLA